MTQSSTNITVLIADDCATVRVALRSILKKAGYSVLGEASDGRTALRMIEQLHPDIVSLDIHMPVMSGLDVLGELRDSAQKTAALVVSADSAKATVHQSFDLGALGYITKPFNEQRVLSAFSQVASVIARHRQGAVGLRNPHSATKCGVIIDDSQADRSQLKTIMKNAGYAISDETEGGMAGLIAVERALPDFVCHAVDLPEIDGLNVLACLQAVHPDIPVIIVSSHNDSETITQAVRNGVKGYIIKPFDAKNVIATLRRVVPIA